MSFYFDQQTATKDLQAFFGSHKAQLQLFGSRVNQTFEAFVFAATIRHYQKNGWATTIENPGSPSGLRLKFSTRGAPKNFSYCRAQKGLETVQIRHQLRVDIAKRYPTQKKRSNICCDVVIMRDVNIDHYSTDSSLPNQELISFGESSTCLRLRN
ncbi:MAG: hypothetical protein IPH75_16210 [bacterium]|nr:hypothetical protein [bacterium]